MAPRQELIRLREGFAQQGEAWLREQLEKPSAQQLRGLAVAAKVPQSLGGRRLSKPELLDALCRGIAEQEASEGMDVPEEDAAVSRQELLRLQFSMRIEADA